MTRVISYLFDDYHSARQAVRDLQEAGFTASDILPKNCLGLCRAGLVGSHGDKRSTATDSFGVGCASASAIPWSVKLPIKPPATAPAAVVASVVANTPAATSGPNPGMAMMPSAVRIPVPAPTAPPTPLGRGETTTPRPAGRLTIRKQPLTPLMK